MLKLLVKKQIKEIFRNYFYDPKKNRARSKAGTIGYILLFIAIMAGVLGGMFTMVSMSICGPLMAAGMDWLFLAIMGLLAILMGTFGSVFNTFSCLYTAKDNDLLLSLPIPVNVLMASRLLTVYIMGVMYSIVVILPAVIVYWITAEVTVKMILGCLLLILLISVFVLTLSCALGWVVAKISMKLKHKGFITVLASLAFFGGYYFFYFRAQMLIGELVANAAVYGEKIRGAAYPIYLFGRVGTGDSIAALAVSAVILALFAGIWWLISRSFLKIATSSGHTAKRGYKVSSLKQKSTYGALLSKEFSRFLSSPIYMLNCGLGILILPLGGIALLWKGSAFISVLNEIFGSMAGSTPILLCATVCMMASMNDMAAPSISLEGKSLWLLQSLPIDPWQVLRAKLNLQLILTGIPVLFCLLCMVVVYPYTVGEMLVTAWMLLSYVLCSALFSLFLGLKMANLTWTSEVTPVKQSGGVLIALFGSFAYTFLFFCGYMLLDGWKFGYLGYVSLFAGVSCVGCVLLWIWLRKKGCRRLLTL